MDPTRVETLFLGFKVRDGLTEDSPFITSVKGPSFRTIRSLTGALHISFRSQRHFSETQKTFLASSGAMNGVRRPVFPPPSPPCPRCAEAEFSSNPHLIFTHPGLRGRPGEHFPLATFRQEQWNIKIWLQFTVTFNSCLISLSIDIDFQFL